MLTKILGSIGAYIVGLMLVVIILQIAGVPQAQVSMIGAVVGLVCAVITWNRISK